MEISAFSRILSVEREIRTDCSYRWENPRAYRVNQLVVQRTVAGACFFEDANGRRVVRAGSAMLFVYDEKSVYGYPEEATAPYELIYLNFLPSLSVRPLFDQLRREYSAIVEMADGGEAATCLDEIWERFQNRTFRDELHESELVTRLCHAIYREQMTGSILDDPIERGHRFIQTRFRLPLNLKMIAAECGVSREHFIREFSRRYGDSPAAMLRGVRLRHAREALLSSRMPVEDIARECGFTNTNSFCRSFRQEFGCSPVKERTKNQQPPGDA